MVARGLLLLSALSLSPTASALAPNPKAAYGAWGGWGVSLAWYANVFGGDRNDTIAAFFSLDAAVPVALQGQAAPQPVPGLGFTIARYNAGASGRGTVAGRTMQPSKNAPPWKLIDTWWPLGPNTLNASADPRQVAYLARAAALAGPPGALVIEVFSNSPPWWMLENADPSGSATGAQDNLLPAMRATHAAYLAAVAAHLAGPLRLPVATVEAFNEPSWPSAWNAAGTQEGCHFDVATQAAVLPLLRPALQAAGLPRSVRVAASDESLTDQALATWRGLPAPARAAIDVVNVHGYQGPEGNRSGLYAEVVLAGRKELRLSEHGEGDGTGATLAAQLLQDFGELHMTSWVYWQAIDEAGGWGFFQGAMTTREVCVAPPPPPPTHTPHFTPHPHPPHTAGSPSTPSTR